MTEKELNGYLRDYMIYCGECAQYSNDELAGDYYSAQLKMLNVIGKLAAIGIEQVKSKNTEKTVLLNSGK